MSHLLCILHTEIECSCLVFFTLALRQTSSWEGAESRDEIDFEWTLKNKTRVQTNYFVGGIGGNEKFVDLGFDCSDGFHNYALLWTPSHLV